MSTRLELKGGSKSVLPISERRWHAGPWLESDRDRALAGVYGEDMRNAFASQKPKFGYAPIFWAKVAAIAYSHEIKIEDLAKLSDKKLLQMHNVHKKTVGWLRENY